MNLARFHARPMFAFAFLVVAACSGAGGESTGEQSDALRRPCGEPQPAPAPTPTTVPTEPAPPPPAPEPPPSGDRFFASGWENTIGLGCDDTALLDRVWESYGGSTACSGSVHDADIVSDMHHAGSRSLRITQKPGGINGTDFRMGKRFGDQADVTLTGWVRYASNYRWATADHKIFIFYDQGETRQNIYVNTRGMADDPQHTRLVLASTPADAVYSDMTPSHLLTVNVWYRLRVHVASGPHGKMEAWLTPEGQPEMKLDMVNEAGSAQYQASDIPTGSIGGVKLDTTYNAGSNVTEPMYQWYDTIAVYRGLYMGQ